MSGHRGFIGTSPVHCEQFESDVTSFYVGLVAWSIVDGELCYRAFLSEDLRPEEDNTEPKWKFPGGDGNKSELWAEAAEREWNEEVMRKSSKVKLDFSQTILVHSKKVPDEIAEHKGGFHEKRFYVFEESKALGGYKSDVHFRSTPKREDDSRGRKGGFLYPTQLIRAATLSTLMRSTEAYFHRQALLRATRFLISKSAELAMAVEPGFRDFVLSRESDWSRG